MNNSEIIKKLIVAGIYAVFAVLFWPFVAPLLFAVLFAFALNPLIKKLRKKFPKIQNYKIFVAGSLMGILTVFFSPIFILIFSAISQIKKLQSGNLEQLPVYQNIQSAVQSVMTFLQSVANLFDFDLASNFDLNLIFSKVSQIILPGLTSVATQLPLLLFNFLIFMTALYLILTNTEFFKKWFNQFNLFSEQQIHQLSDLIQKICYLVLISTVVVATAQALVISVACLFAGYNDFIILFMIAFFMSFVPVVGSAPLAIALIIYSFVNSNITAGIILIVAASIAASIDNVIRAYMFTAKGDSGIHPFISLMALIGSLSLFGFVGLFLGPIICELAVQVGGIFFKNEESEII